jgi:phosphoenolpyruvate carboxykinase (ATP)
MEFGAELNRTVERHSGAKINPGRAALIEAAVRRKEALVARAGCLATWTPPESTGRSPRDTLIARRPESEGNIDWDSPNNLPVDPETFDMLWADAIRELEAAPEIFVTDRAAGADPRYALPVRTVADRALSALFTENMFRPVPENIGDSRFALRGFSLLVLPYRKIDAAKYEGRLRKLSDGRTSDIAIAMDFDRRVGLVYGSAYGGSVKKLVFTVMNYYLPLEGILPIHCSANESAAGELSLFLGLSGTGKTTLSADPDRALLGDDEHGWSEHGIANFENGCYAKLIDLDPDKEPEIFHAVFHETDWREHGVIVENALMYPDGVFDLFDDRLTPNSRASYPLAFLRNIKPDSTGPHPRAIVFLTADANGVLPPISRLDPDQAMFWFLMGYTSKLAGTETGVVDPVSTFSRFFGQPFMPCLPRLYADLLGEKMRAHETRVFLVNTGWTGGPYGEGHRMDIARTRALLRAALDGKLDAVEYEIDDRFHIAVPRACPGVDDEILDPKATWSDPAAYEKRADRLARDFCDHFAKAYGNKDLPPEVVAQCPTPNP